MGTDTPALRIAFMGTPDFAVPALRAIHESHHDLVCVYSQPPRPKGRGHHVQKSPVHLYADKHSIPVFTPASMKKSEAKEQFKSHNLDVAIVAAYGQILRQDILDTPKYGCINIHASILPRWRGASPIQHAIWAGDKESGVSIMQMDVGLDTGPVIKTLTCPITDKTNAQSLHDTLGQLGADAITDILDTLAQDGKLDAAPQDDERSTYAPLLKKEDGRIDWTKSAHEIDCQLRGLSIWPGVWTQIDGNIFKIKSATRSTEKTEAKSGTILDRHGKIACGDGNILQITDIQPPGKKAMDFPSAVNGGYITPDSRFESPAQS